MTDMPTDFRQFLNNTYSFELPIVEQSLESTDHTTKYRLRLFDGNIIEMVLIPDRSKSTLCISSQVGCSRNCAFCATAKLGLERNLDTHEIVGQIVLVSSLNAQNIITNLVFMGIGEPLDNLQSVIDSLLIIQADNTLSFSPRRTTISTCGIPEGIIKLADSGVKTKLAVSLNSAIDEKRDLLMPINRKYPLRELKQAILYFLRKTSYRVTFEYVLIPDCNMDSEDLLALKRFVGDISCKINFIPFNSIPAMQYKSPTQEQIDSFLKQAQGLNQAVTLRKSRGSEVFGACGQLAGIYKTKETR